MINNLTLFFLANPVCVLQCSSVDKYRFFKHCRLLLPRSEKTKQMRDAVEQANLSQYVNNEFVDEVKTEVRLKVLSQRH